MKDSHQETWIDTKTLMHDAVPEQKQHAGSHTFTLTNTHARTHTHKHTLRGPYSMDWALTKPHEKCSYSD